MSHPETNPGPDTANPGRITPEDGADFWRIRFVPGPGIFAAGLNPLALLDELAGLGDNKISALTDRIPPLEELDPEQCFMGWEIRLATDKGIDAVKDVFIFTGDDCLVDIVPVKEGERQDENTGTGPIHAQASQPSQAQENRAGVSSKQPEPAAAGNPGGKQKDTHAVSSMRVAADKLDTLVDLVGELVTVQARLGGKAAGSDDPELVYIAEQLEHLTSELRDNTMNIRMLPIGATFSRFKRLVRDLCGATGKQVCLETMGGKTELDKTVIERLNDPLVHIIRNSIDHGIETPDIRKAAGKPLDGTLSISAAHAGGSVLIRIMDDGKGLDPEKIRKAAEARGLASPGDNLSEEQLFSLIFAPGFSTAEAVTDVSGRGVGMDVVRNAVEALQGTIDIESAQGRGTTVTLRLPLTLAIIDGLLVGTGQETYVIPLSAIDECLEITREEMAGFRP